MRGTARRPDAAAWLAEQGVEIVPADLLDRDALRPRCGRVPARWSTPRRGPEGRDCRGSRVTEATSTARRTCLRPPQAAGVERFIYISSVAVYGLNRAPVIDETAATPQVGQAYPDSKIVAEALVRSMRLPYVIIRPASTYGPRGDSVDARPDREDQGGPAGAARAGPRAGHPGLHRQRGRRVAAGAEPAGALGETFNLCDDRAVSLP